MNKRTHVLTGFVLATVITLWLHPPMAHDSAESLVMHAGVMATTWLEVSIPIVLGSILPDVDTEVGTHRKTLHNIPVFGLLYVFPTIFGNLAYVWIGVLAHYLLDMWSTNRGVALLYPLSRREYRIPRP